ncbi:MAG: DNA/RNA non-specific endonuclease [Verrucomicrobiota bacterium]
MARRKKTRSSGKPASSARTRRRRPRWLLWFNLLLITALAGWYVFQPPARRAEVNRLVRNSIDRDKRIQPLDVAWDIYQLYYSPDFVAVAPAPGDHTHAYAGLPAPTGSNGRDDTIRLLANRGYLVGYDDSLPSPRWAAYRVADLTPLPPAPERPTSFATDPRTASRVSSDAFTNTGYDRGHLAPNFAIATRHGEQAQLETFFLSNIIPQKHALNAGLWKQLETRIATSYPARFGEVWIVAGPVFTGTPPPTLGRDGPALPDACYMIILDESDGRLRAMAFVFPQNAAGELDRYLTTIDHIETRTGLDFFPALENAAENQLESRPASRVW